MTKQLGFSSGNGRRHWRVGRPRFALTSSAPACVRCWTISCCWAADLNYSRKQSDFSLDGDTVALRMCMDRLPPVRKASNTLIFAQFAFYIIN
jgi:hypothetical protein